MKIYNSLQSFTAHKQQSKRRRNTAYKSLSMKGLPLLASNRLTPLVGWLHSSVSSAQTHLVRSVASHPLQPLTPLSPSAMLLPSGAPALAGAAVQEKEGCGWRSCRCTSGSHLRFSPSSALVTRQPLCSWGLFHSEVQERAALPAAATPGCSCLESPGLCCCPCVYRN